MFRIPAPLIASSSGFDVIEITEDTYIGDLYTFLGSPGVKKDFSITANNVDVGVIIISTAFVTGSTFEFIAINGGRFLGEGGNGGNGGNDYGSTGEAGEGGTDGTAAIINQGNYDVSINVDDGFIFGGGGGGGGGSYTDQGAGGDAGNGGGGGQGWSGGAKGDGGIFSGLPASVDGTAGSRILAGLGGVYGDSTSDGGNGGTWGLGGRSGRSSNMVTFGSTGTWFYHGGKGGRAGAAYAGGNLTLSGTETEADLRASGRILGELGVPALNTPSFAFSFYAASAGIGVSSNVGIQFDPDGSTLEINTGLGSPPTKSTVYYLSNGSGTGADYEVRISGRTGDVDGAFTSEAAVPGTWIAITSIREWYWQLTNQTRGALFEMRRVDIPGTTSTSDEVMHSFFIKGTQEDAS